MLKLQKQRGSPNWYARGTQLGVFVYKSLGTSDKRQAERLLAKLQNEIYEGKTRSSNTAAEGFSAAALRYMEAGAERRFLAPLLSHFGDTPFDKIDQQAIDRAAVSLYPKGSNGTRNRQVYTPVSAILKFSGGTFSVRHLKVRPGVVRWLEPHEAANLLTACALHLRPLVMFMLYTGARAGEAVWLDWRCVDLQRAHVSFPKTKSGYPRSVPLHRDLVVALANLPHREGEVFRKPDGKAYKRPVGDFDTSAGSRITTAFRGALRRSGIKNFRVHDLRHTWATWHYAARRDLVALQTLGGWRSLAMVTRYPHASSERHLESINALPAFGEITVESKLKPKKSFL
jgi:integrase